MKKIQSEEYNQIPIYEDFVLEPYQKGFIPVSRLENWREFQTFFSKESGKFIYRGHKEGVLGAKPRNF